MSVVTKLRRAEHASKGVMLAICAYEAAAIVCDGEPLPMISEVMHRHRWAIPVFLGVLTVHFWFLPEKVRDVLP